MALRHQLIVPAAEGARSSLATTICNSRRAKSSAGKGDDRVGRCADNRLAFAPFFQVISQRALIAAQGRADPPYHPDCRSHIGVSSERTAPPIFQSVSFRQGMPGLRRRGWRAAPFPRPQIASKTLQRGSHALITEQGCAGSRDRVDSSHSIARAQDLAFYTLL